MIRSLFLTYCLFFAGLVALAQPRSSQQLVGEASAQPVQFDNMKGRILSPYSILVRGGLTQFYGELGDQKMKGMFGLSFVGQTSPAFSVGLDLTAGKLGGEKREFFNSYFVNEYNTIELLGRWDLTEQFKRYDKINKLHFGVYGGLGVMYFSSDAYDLTTDDLVRFTNSRASGRNPVFLRWGNPKGRIGVTKTHERVIPLGLTLDYQLTNTWKAGIDFRFYMARNDKLDATSGRNLDIPNQSTSYSDTPNDKFSFVSLTVSRRFTQKIKDADQDGIADDRDRCPDVPGLAKFFGCPDTDNDGIPDYVDRCPEVAGPVSTRGCPDTDGDGVVDQNDECPTVAGTVNGCPDRDGDGVQDEQDSCPDVAGLVRFGGCPDTDGDAIPDQVDFCPTIPGTYENGGCPDSDGDGVHDGIDKCPSEPGTAQNNGCPEQ